MWVDSTSPHGQMVGAAVESTNNKNVNIFNKTSKLRSVFLGSCLPSLEENSTTEPNQLRSCRVLKPF